MHFDCVSRTDVGLKRKVNEDSVLARTEAGLWAVADGMGGHEAGEVASAKVVEALASVSGADGLDQLVDEAVAALARANGELIVMAGAGNGQRMIGSTVVALAIADGRYCCFWAGDSRGYRLRDGELVQLSRDHSVVQSLVDAGMLKPEEAEFHESANVITRAVGVATDLNVDRVGGEVQAGDLFLLASDGLTRLVANAEMAAELGAKALDEAADTLLELALERGAPDNVSLVITRAS